MKRATTIEAASAITCIVACDAIVQPTPRRTAPVRLSSWFAALLIVARDAAGASRTESDRHGGDDSCHISDRAEENVVMSQPSPSHTDHRQTSDLLKGSRLRLMVVVPFGPRH